MTTEQHTAQEQPTGAGAEQVIAQNREASPSIDPEKLLELAKSRHHDGGVTLGWPTVIKIVEELRQGRDAAEERDALTKRVQFLNEQNSVLLDHNDELAAPNRDMVAHMHRQIAFSARAFGPGDRQAGVIDHIRKELREIEEAPQDLEEWIDVVLLALDGAWRSGYTAEEVVAMLDAKLTKNENREWPDWRTADRTKAIEHDRTKDREPTA